jgi:hypothetical protein
MPRARAYPHNAVQASRQHLYVLVLFRASPWAKMAFDAPQKLTIL